LTRLPADDSARGPVEQIRKAGLRAAALLMALSPPPPPPTTPNVLAPPSDPARCAL
jgi:hypothetical protein